MQPALLAICCLFGLSACDTIRSVATGLTSPFSGPDSYRGSANEIDGTRFRTRLSANRDDPRSFVTSTRGAARNPLAAVEAGRVEAVRHCLGTFGGSDIVWSRGPDTQIAIDPSGVLVLSGRCITR